MFLCISCIKPLLLVFSPNYRDVTGLCHHVPSWDQNRNVAQHSKQHGPVERRHHFHSTTQTNLFLKDKKTIFWVQNARIGLEQKCIWAKIFTMGQKYTVICIKLFTLFSQHIVSSCPSIVWWLERPAWFDLLCSLLIHHQVSLSAKCQVTASCSKAQKIHSNSEKIHFKQISSHFAWLRL